MTLRDRFVFLRRRAQGIHVTLELRDIATGRTLVRRAYGGPAHERVRLVQVLAWPVASEGRIGVARTEDLRLEVMAELVR